jgi:hypothetical protein
MQDQATERSFVFGTSLACRRPSALRHGFPDQCVAPAEALESSGGEETTMYRATQRELQQYEDLGFFVREDVFSMDEVEILRKAAENVHAQILDAADRPDVDPVDQVDNQKYQRVLGSMIKWESNDDLRAVRSMEPTGHLDARLEGVIGDPRVYRPVASINGCDRLSVFSDKLNVKRPGGAPFPWHQEGLYWQHGAENLASSVSTLTYLDDATQANGCLW